MSSQRGSRLAAALALAAAGLLPATGWADMAIASASATVIDPIAVETTRLGQAANGLAAASPVSVDDPPIDAVRVTIGGSAVSTTVSLAQSAGDWPGFTIELE